MAKKTTPQAAKKDQVKSSRSKSSASKSPKTQPKKQPQKASLLIDCPDPDCTKTFKTKAGLNSHRIRKHPELIRPGPGRPLKYETQEALEEAIQAYFTSCQHHWEEKTMMKPVYDYKDLNEDNPEAKPNFKKVLRVIDGKVEYETVIEMIEVPAVVPTVTGLAVALDTTRRTLLDYEASDEYSHTIKAAKTRIEAFNEAILVNGGAVPAGVIFNLKNNWGWVDRQELDVTDKAAAAKKALDNLERAKEDNDDFAAEAEMALKNAKG